MKKIKINFYEYIWCYKEMSYIGMGELCEDLYHCAISIFHEDLMRSSLIIDDWSQIHKCYNNTRALGCYAQPLIIKNYEWFVANDMKHV